VICSFSVAKQGPEGSANRRMSPSWTILMEIGVRELDIKWFS
jgi:hypothetical protein